MINLSAVINNPAFNQTFTVYRQNGSWQAGRWVPRTETPIIVSGIVSKASPEDLVQVPEGDRSTEARVFYTTAQLFNTHSQTVNNTAAGTSDEVFWNNQRYRIYSIGNYSDYGYYKSVGVRKGGG